MKCVSCGSEIGSNKFCSYCGTKANIKPKFCSNCGSKITKDADYCIKCGKKTCDNTLKENNDNSNMYLLGALLSFLIPKLSIFVPGLGSLSGLSFIGVIVFLSLGMHKYPDKKYFKALLILYIVLSLVFLLTVVLIFATCISTCKNMTY